MVQKTIRTKGTLVTLMHVVSAAGKAYKPVVIFPGRMPRCRVTQRRIQTIKDVLMDFYLYYRDVPGADT